MASPNHKVGLAVVVPAIDNRSQPCGRMNQNAFHSPRKISTQPNGMTSYRSSNGTPGVPSHFTGFASPRQQNRTTSIREPSALSPQHQLRGFAMQNSNGAGRPHAPGMATQQSNESIGYELKGVVPPRRRLLEVDEALQFSPLSSIVPFGLGTSYSIYWPRHKLTAQVLYLYRTPTFLAHSKSTQPYRSSISPSSPYITSMKILLRPMVDRAQPNVLGMILRLFWTRHL